MKIDFVGPAYESRSRSIDYQECVNWYPEVEQPNSKNVVSLINTPGTVAFLDDSSGSSCRGLWTTSTGRLYKVSGNKVYEILINGAQVKVGEINTFVGSVSMADNGIEVMIVDGDYGYILTLDNNVLAQVKYFSNLNDDDEYEEDTSEAWPGASHVVFIAGYFVCQWKGERGRFMWSASYNGKAWDALSRATAESSPDSLVAIAKANNELWLVGSQTTEVWYLSGNSDLPFTRVSSSLVDIGTISPYSVATNGNVVFWLGSNAAGQGIVWMTTGYQPTRISTHAIEFVISGIERADNAIAFCYQQEGHQFYVLTFATGNRTIVYDLTTGMWHERGTFNALAGDNQKYLASCYAFYNQKNYVGDYRDGSVHELSLDAYDDVGTAIVRRRTSPHLASENKRLFCHYIEADFEKGVGLTTGQGSDPQVMLDWSNDGGFTWGDERWRSIGKIGTYKTRIKWNRLGMSRDRIYRITVSDPVKTILVDCYASMESE